MAGGPLVWLAASSINVGTDPSGLPGSAEVLSLLSGLRWLALAAALAGLLIGGIAWVVGSHSDNLRWTHRGRLGVIASLAGAVVMGAAPELVSFFYSAGGKVH